MKYKFKLNRSDIGGYDIDPIADHINSYIHNGCVTKDKPICRCEVFGNDKAEIWWDNIWVARAITPEKEAHEVCMASWDIDQELMEVIEPEDGADELEPKLMKTEALLDSLYEKYKDVEFEVDLEGIE